MRLFLSILLICFGYAFANAQTDYHFFVQFEDKGLNYVDISKPELFLSQRSIERRERLNIPIDSADLPVTKAYITNITKPSLHVRYVSKWLNGAVITTQSMDTAWQLKIKFFVKDVVYLGKSARATGINGRQAESDAKMDYGKGLNQLELNNGTSLHNAGYQGQNMVIAVFDAGFRKANELSLFKPLFDRNGVIYTNDLVDLETSVYDDDDHGLHVLGILTANKPSTFIGSAPEANYVLIRTESNYYETWLEELNWVRAAEIADSLGVDVINSSLGYNKFDEERLNHTHEQLDGKTAYISRGAAYAASRGMFVVSSAGNDGNKSWGKLDFPADVEEILVVGAVDNSLEPTKFSSPGPTADLRLKPDVTALGKNTRIATTYGNGTGNGTSYSAPIITGLSACLWQANTSLTPDQLKRIIIQSSHLSLHPDYLSGNGAPNFKLALIMTGADKQFDYSKASVVDIDSSKFKRDMSITIFAPNQSYVSCKVRIKKRFLFFKYLKTKWTYDAEVFESNFAKIGISLSTLPAEKPVVLEFYSENKEGKITMISKHQGIVQ